MKKITKDDIKSRYKEYNKLYFGNQLKRCKFSVQKQHALGTYTYKRSKDRTITGHIWITTDVEWTEETLREVIIHEMIHHYVRTIDRRFSGLFGHGYPFIKQCRRLKRDYGLNISVIGNVPHPNEEPLPPIPLFFYKLSHLYTYL